jgi:hypothetical protein
MPSGQPETQLPGETGREIASKNASHELAPANSPISVGKTIF